MWCRALLGIGLASVLASAFDGPVKADFIGQSMIPSYDYPVLGSVYANSSWAPASFVVGPGQETDGSIEGVTDLLVDFAANSLTVTLRTVLSNPTWNTVAFNGPVFSAAALLDIAGASIDPATTMAGFDISRVSFGAHDIALDWNGLSYVDGTVVRIDFAFVPEPAAVALFGFGLVGMLAVRRPRFVAPR
jgi:hypothetical protein